MQSTKRQILFIGAKIYPIYTWQGEGTRLDSASTAFALESSLLLAASEWLPLFIEVSTTLQNSISHRSEV